MKSDYIQQNDDAFNAQLQTFKNGIGNYAAVIGVTAAQMAGQAADAAYYDYVLKCMNLMSNGSLQWTGWKNLTRGGGNRKCRGKRHHAIPGRHDRHLFACYDGKEVVKLVDVGARAIKRPVFPQ